MANSNSSINHPSSQSQSKSQSQSQSQPQSSTTTTLDQKDLSTFNSSFLTPHDLNHSRSTSSIHHLKSLPSSSSSSSSNLITSNSPNLIKLSINNNNLTTNNKTTTKITTKTTTKTNITDNNSNLSIRQQTRSSTPARFIGSSSPLPAPSTYALVSSTRNLGTPTSDIRGTSPSAIDHDQFKDQDSSITHHHSDHLSKSHHTNWSQETTNHQNLLENLNHSKLQSILPITDQPNSNYLNPSHSILSSSSSNSISNIHIENSFHQDLNCFWAILDTELKFMYVDPNLIQQTGLSGQEINNKPIYQFIHPADLDQVNIQLEPIPQTQPITENQNDQKNINSNRSLDLSLTLNNLNSNDLDPRKIQSTNSRVVLRFRFARLSHLFQLIDSNSSSYSSKLQSINQQYKPIELFLNPISSCHFLAFFHSIIDSNSATSSDSILNSPYSPSPWSTTTISNINPSSLCGITQSDPESHYFNCIQKRTLQLAFNQSNKTDSLHHLPASSIDRSSCFKQTPPLELFLILNSNNGRVLFSHSSSTPALSTFDHSFCPDDYAKLAMQSKQDLINQTNKHKLFDFGHTNCSRQLSAHHNLIQNGKLLKVLQLFVIQYGSLTFAAFHSNTPNSQTQSNLIQPSTSIMAHIKSSPIEIKNDSKPIPLDLYSNNSSNLTRSQKRPRTDSCFDLITPQTTTNLQSFNHPNYQRPSTHPNHQYSSFPSSHLNHLNHLNHHLNHLNHLPSSQLSPINSNIQISDSSDPYGSQYTHFSGELSPTMASAANVLGSFHRAHYHHPQSILALQDVHHHQLSSSSSTHPSMLAYDNYGLQNLASMAIGTSFDHQPSDFSPTSSSSSPHPVTQESFGSVINGLSTSVPLNVHRIYRNLPKRAIGTESLTDTSNDGLLDIHMSTTSQLSGSSYGSLTGTSSSLPLGLNETQIGIKRTRLNGSEVIGNTNIITNTDPSIVAVRSCTNCGAQNSPEWRKGPNGVKSLCNACGLRFSRAQARKSKIPKGLVNNSNTNSKKIGSGINKKKSINGSQQANNSSVLGDQDGRLVIEGFRG